MVPAPPPCPSAPGDDVAALARFLRPTQGGGLLVVTGAGASVASGIPTFRGTDPDAVWRHDVTELGTFGFFQRDPVASWRWYLDRFARVFDAQPNPTHHALVDLERAATAQGDPFLLVTQNVDGLHRAAGSERLVEVHGRADSVRCARPGCTHGAPRGRLARAAFDFASFAAAPSPATLPRCPACRAPLRQHVLWFDETYDSHVDYEFPRVLDAAERADRVLFVGTSYSVGITDAILSRARWSGARLVGIDPGGHASPRGMQVLRAPAEVLLPAAVAAAVA